MQKQAKLHTKGGGNRSGERKSEFRSTLWVDLVSRVMTENDRG